MTTPTLPNSSADVERAELVEFRAWKAARDERIRKNGAYWLTAEGRADVCGQKPEKVAIKHAELSSVVVCEKCRDAAAGAEQDAARLDWLQAMWADGVHAEVCAKGDGTTWHALCPAASVFVGPQTFVGDTLREAIDAAMAVAKEQKL